MALKKGDWKLKHFLKSNFELIFSKYNESKGMELNCIISPN